VQFDGTQWYLVRTCMIDIITDMVIYNDELAAPGYFTTAGCINANHIASWNGTQWSASGSRTP